jgi:hypothetical protein
MILDNADSYLASLLLPILACRTVLDLYLDEMQGVMQSLYGILELLYLGYDDRTQANMEMSMSYFSPSVLQPI